jgi:hypothetical protein
MFPSSAAGATFVWEWDHVAAIYLQLMHFNGGVFNVSGWLAVLRSFSSFVVGYNLMFVRRAASI